MILDVSAGFVFLEPPDGNRTPTEQNGTYFWLIFR